MATSPQTRGRLISAQGKLSQSFATTGWDVWRQRVQWRSFRLFIHGGSSTKLIAKEQLIKSLLFFFACSAQQSLSQLMSLVLHRWRSNGCCWDKLANETELKLKQKIAKVGYWFPLALYTILLPFECKKRLQYVRFLASFLSCFLIFFEKLDRHWTL